MIATILEKDHILPYLEARHLVKQYQKAKSLVIAGIYGKTDLKFRKPKSDGVISFRINLQFRAFGFLEEDTLIVYKISNHQ